MNLGFDLLAIWQLSGGWENLLGALRELLVFEFLLVVLALSLGLLPDHGCHFQGGAVGLVLAHDFCWSWSDQLNSLQNLDFCCGLESDVRPIFLTGMMERGNTKADCQVLGARCRVKLDLRQQRPVFPSNRQFDARSIKFVIDQAVQ